MAVNKEVWIQGEFDFAGTETPLLVEDHSMITRIALAVQAAEKMYSLSKKSPLVQVAQGLDQLAVAGDAELSDYELRRRIQGERHRLNVSSFSNSGRFNHTQGRNVDLRTHAAMGRGWGRR